MLNIHTPLRRFRLTIQRSSGLKPVKPDTSLTGAESEKLDDPPAQSASEDEIRATL
jgi:hypothetical protein